jgi:predicted ATPase/DNA-binding winged helix-turn-helix (wHTH) protein
VADNLWPLKFDAQQRQLRLGNKVVELRPKEATVLRYLIDRAGNVVSVNELHSAVWSGVKVGADSLKTIIYELRKQLGDSSRPPRYIETVPRRGYRFIGPLHPLPSLSSPVNPTAPLAGLSLLSTSSFVGRDVELATLSNLFTQALTRQRQIVFISGESGIGKTTLVEMFVKRLPPTPATVIVRGQCVEQYGGKEAYRPLLEAIDRLCQEGRGKEQRALLHRHAPMVLAQLPTLLSSAERYRLQGEVLGVPPGRILREFVVLVEALSHHQPLVIILEDLQWSDFSTIDMLSAFAQRNDTARVLIIGTYRPMDALRDGHPVHAAVQALREHGRCVELPVPPLTEAEVTSYLTARFAYSAIMPETLGASIHQRTAGNPLFVKHFVDDVLARGPFPHSGDSQDGSTVLGPLHIPKATIQLIERQLRRLTATKQEVLVAASVVGKDFSAAAVAEAMNQDVVQIEAICEELVLRQQFIQHQGTRRIPERRLTTRYSFRHTLYCEVLALSIPAARYRQLYNRIEQWKKKSFEARTLAQNAEVSELHEGNRD